MSMAYFFFAFIPKLYENVFQNKDFPYIFYFNQIFFIIGAFFHLILALRWHEKIGIPSWLFYMFIGQVLEHAERIMTQVTVNTIVSLVCPKGIEASMTSVNTTIIVLNMFVLKGLIGVLVNRLFFSVDNTNLEQKMW